MEVKKKPVNFFEDSFTDFACKLMTTDFTARLLNFSQNERDNINEETVELLEPYLTLKSSEGEDLFTADIA